MRHEVIEQKYPHVISMMMWACSLSTTEAVCCLRDYMDGSMFSGEAVNHMGGTTRCVRHAATCRNEFAVIGETETYTSILRRWRFYLPRKAA